ncbi:MAG: hypothetical protein HYV97_10760 [Bdellovibrio sp.]|nr:hypothetical protein [Bdellovibrio sp.]
MPKQSAAKNKRHKTGKKSPDTEKLTFVRASGPEDYKKIFEYNIDAFSDTPDFKWTLGDIEHEVQDGWDLYSVNLGKDTIAAVFLKKDKDRLLSKNTAIKMNYQGSGHSHKIKGFIEEKAISLHARYIYHYCRIDNFRMYSLNESHGYRKTNHKFGENGQVVEWMKTLKD